jgi:hypothetical protein
VALLGSMNENGDESETGRRPAMTDLLIYWRDYRRNVAEDRVHGWYSNSRLLGGLQAGDRLWMVTSGTNVGSELKQAGFLVGIWTIKRVVENAGDDEVYPRASYRFFAIADQNESLIFEEPVLVDHILRPAGRDKSASIGRFLQGPRKLTGEKLRLLRAAAGPDLALRWLTGQRIRLGSVLTTGECP